MQETTNTLQAVVTLEPWRQRVGYPISVTDQMWNPDEHQNCDGEIVWEGKLWHCRKCGYIGWSTLPIHYPILSPKAFFERCRDHHVHLRVAEGVLTRKQIDDHMYFVMAAALQNAAKRPPERVRDFVEGMSRL